MEGVPAFEAISPWVGVPSDLQAPLTDDLRADVVLVRNCEEIATKR